MNAADDFDTIRARVRELFPQETSQAPGQHIWIGRPGSGRHCTHCPKAADEACHKSCLDEAVNKGLFKQGDTWPPGPSNSYCEG